jgi:hypothetical protein
MKKTWRGLSDIYTKSVLSVFSKINRSKDASHKGNSAAKFAHYINVTGPTIGKSD